MDTERVPFTTNYKPLFLEKSELAIVVSNTIEMELAGISMAAITGDRCP
jgi:hypothetical protein